jgi:hypothetical protein
VVPSEPSFPVRSYVEYLGEDISEVQVWRGHPGRVIDTEQHDLAEEVVVGLVGGPSMSFPVGDLRALDATSYRRRGERVVFGRHPLEDREVGSPITADG